MSNIREILNELPPDHELCKNGDGSVSLRIDALENFIDYLEDATEFVWSTKNYTFRLYADHNGELSIYGSLEVHIWCPALYKEQIKVLTGSANFKLINYTPNTDYAATCKSLCQKNAASDWFPRTGRGLNGGVPHPDHQQPRGEYFATNGKKNEIAKKVTPDDKIRLAFAKAVNDKNQAEVDKLLSIYDFEIR